MATPNQDAVRVSDKSGKPTCKVEEKFSQPFRVEEVSEAGMLANFIVPTMFSLLPQVTAMTFTGWTVGNRQLGLDVYRGIRCFELGSRGLQRYYDHRFNQIHTQTENAVSQSNDVSLNRDMFGYLLADTLVQGMAADKRIDLLVHHVMGLTLWGSSLAFGIMPDVVAMNVAVEILSALKGIEYSVKGSFLGDQLLLRNQRILKAAYAFRLAVILGIRYPIWIWVDWPIPNERYEEIGPLGWGVYRALNIGIIGLETLWLYQTTKAFSRLRFI